MTHANFDTDLGFLESNTWGGSKLAAQRRRHLLFQGWGLANKQNDVKTAFNVNVLRPSDPYSVHQPYSTMWEEEDLCLADLNRTTHIWMNRKAAIVCLKTDNYTS